MGDIYKSAQKVLVWLGNNDEQTDVAMELFPIVIKLVKQIEERSTGGETDESLGNILEWRGSLATALNNLFNRSW